MNAELNLHINPELIKSMQKLYESVGLSTEQLKVMQELAKPTIKQQKSMAKAIQPSLKIAQSIRENIVPSLKLIENFQNQFIPIFDKELIENIIKWKEQKESPEYQNFIKEWRWFFGKKKYSFGDYCFGLYKKHGSIDFENQLVSWFSTKDKMVPLIEDIKSKFPLRYPIIQDGLDLHLKNKYASAITLMLPQAEGILWDIGQRENLVEDEYNTKNKDKGFAHNGGKLEWSLPEISKKLFPNDKFHKILVAKIFNKGPRNKILHGRNIYKGEEKEVDSWLSTLLILTIWRLSDEIKIVEESVK